MQKRNLNPARILQAARQVVNDGGSEALTFSNVAAVLAVRSQALYGYYANSSQLKFALIMDYLDTLTRDLNQALVGVSGEQALLIYGRQLRQALLAEPNLTKLAFGGINYQREQETAQHLHELVLVLDRLIAPYYPDHTTVIAQARYFRAIVFGYVQNELWGLFRLATPSADETFNSALHQVITSITAKGVKQHG